MKINNLKINGFGKIKEKQIELTDNINIIYGENEAGKSTILKFLISMFYGLSKNKNGGSIPEIEKYEPWNAENFSGKIEYNLDDSNKYEVYRDFKKKNIKIFNKNMEDITKDFPIDKTKGNQFFYEQIGVEEEIFTSSIISKQTEVKLDEKNQNCLMQKISNILGTGEDTTSYQTIVNKLKKKIVDEVGTTNTKERPINIVENTISSLCLEKNELEKYKIYKFEIDEKINYATQDIYEKEKRLLKLRNANIQKQKLSEIESKIGINKNILNDIENNIKQLNEQKNKYKLDTSKGINIVNILVLACIMCSIVFSTIFIKNIVVTCISGISSIAYILYIILKIKKINNKNKEIKINKLKVEESIRVLERNKENQINELEKIEIEYKTNLLKIKNENNIEDLNNLIEKIDNIQKLINDEQIKLYTLKIDNDNIISKLERNVTIKEKLEELYQEKNELEEKRENIKRALDYVEIAYNKMKEQITPIFTEELSNTMNKISNGKYKRVKININGEILVEDSITGEYIKAEMLSIGTLEQLYLSLRLASIRQITKENMPIILDESFAYYDNARLENILRFLADEYKDKQVIIFTCTKRETEILNKLNIMFNFIEI